MNYDDKFKEFLVTSTTHAILSDGIWEVKQNVTQKRLEEGTEWEEKSANVSAFDSDLETAFKNAYISMGTYLESIGGDLFEVDEELKETLQ